MSSLRDIVLQGIVDERDRQDAKWGEQNHDDGEWALILLEELGEAAKEILENRDDNATTELEQAAAVVVAWIECRLRRNLKGITEQVLRGDGDEQSAQAAR